MTLEVLLVEDNPGDVRLTRETLRDANMPICLHVAPDGMEAMAFLQNQSSYADAPRPDLILLDLYLPKMDGRALLGNIRAQESLRTIPTIVLTVCDEESNFLRSHNVYADGYLTKPMRLDAFESLVRSTLVGPL